jgi:hypothetical protein
MFNLFSILPNFYKTFLAFSAIIIAIYIAVNIEKFLALFKSRFGQKPLYKGCFRLLVEPLYDIYSSQGHISGSRLRQILIADQVIKLKKQLGDITIELVVGMTKHNDKKVEIFLGVYPVRQDIFLPKGLQIMILNESQDIKMELQARNRDNYMEIDFIDYLSEGKFSIRLVLGNLSITEDFVT